MKAGKEKSQESKAASIEIEKAIKLIDTDILSFEDDVSVIFVVFVFAPKIGLPLDGKTLLA